MKPLTDVELQLVEQAAMRLGYQMTEAEIRHANTRMRVYLARIVHELRGRYACSLTSREIAEVQQSSGICSVVHFAIAFAVLLKIERFADDLVERASDGSRLQ